MFSTPEVQVCLTFLSSPLLVADPIIVRLLRHALEDRHLPGVTVLSLRLQHMFTLCLRGMLICV